MQDDLDKNLQSMFQQKRSALPEEPFCGNMLKLIEKRRARRIFVQRLMLVLGLFCCALVSPYLIRGSVFLSGGLNALFGVAARFMNTPLGIGSAALCVLLLFIFKRRWFSAIV